MSQGKPIPLAEANPIAGRLLELLRPACKRVAIAGSIRRAKPMVSDIEIVAIPDMVTRTAGDLWGSDVEVDALEEHLVDLRSSDLLRLRDVENRRRDGSVDVSRRDGAAYKALEYEGLPVDLFIVRDPDIWGVIFALRTGPGDWNTRLVTDAHRFLRRVQDGWVYRSGQPVPCVEEEDFFRAIGQPWVEPAERSVARVDIRAVL